MFAAVVLGAWVMLASGGTAALATATPPVESAPWDVARATQVALTRAPEILAAQRQLAQAEAAEDATGWGAWPAFTLDTLVSVAPGQAGNAQDADGTLLRRWGPLLRLSLRGDWALYTFGRLSAEQRAAAHRTAEARARVTEAALNVGFAVRRAFSEWHGARQRAAVLARGTEALVSFERHLARLEEDDDEDYDPVDVMRLRVASAELQALRTAAERDAHLAMRRIAHAVGAPVAPTLPLRESPRDATAVTALARTALPFDKLLTMMRALNPRLQASRAREAALRCDGEARQAAQWPEVFVAGGLEFFATQASDPQWSPFAFDAANGWEAGLGIGVRWPLDLPRRYLAHESAAAAAGEASAALGALWAELEFALAEAHREVTDIQELLSGKRRAARAARAVVLARQDAYEAGLCSFNDALAPTLDAVYRHLDVIAAVVDLEVAMARLSRIVGTDIAALYAEVCGRGTCPP